MEETIAKLLLSEMAIICILALYQESRVRMVIASAFAVSMVGHYQIFSLLSVDMLPTWLAADKQDAHALMYYWIAALFDLSIILIVSNLNIVPRLAADIQMVSFISILLNLAGWSLYMAEQDPIIYQTIMITLYLWAILLMIRQEPKDDRDFSNNPWISAFRLTDYQGRSINNSHQEKTWPAN